MLITISLHADPFQTAPLTCWSVVTPIRPGTPPAELAALKASFAGYGLGFFLRDYRGYKVVWHTGGLPGYVSKVAMIPDARLGIAILTNQESGSAFEAIADHIMDAYLGAQTSDWIAAYQAIEKRGQGELRDLLITADTWEIS